MIISCGDLSLVGSTRHQKVSQNPPVWPCGSVGWCSKGCTRTLTIYGVARDLVGGPVGWCSKKLHQNFYSGWLVFSLLRRWGGVPKVGVVFQKVVPESPTCILLNEAIFIFIFKIFHFLVVMFLVLRPLVYIFLKSFDLLECLVMLMTLILVIRF